jgi:large subunit ribosomal protein L35
VPKAEASRFSPCSARSVAGRCLDKNAYVTLSSVGLRLGVFSERLAARFLSALTRIGGAERMEVWIAMAKMKTHKGAAKRFGRTASGKFRRGKAFRSHLLGSKTAKRKRGLRQPGLASDKDEKRIARMLPYA